MESNHQSRRPLVYSQLVSPMTDRPVLASRESVELPLRVLETPMSRDTTLNLEPDTGIEPVSSVYKTAASPRMLNRRELFIDRLHSLWFAYSSKIHKRMVVLNGFAPLTFGVSGRCSDCLSYRTLIGWQYWTRTNLISD